MKFDLGHFKKSQEDHKSATLIHPNGHKIVIAKASLSPNLKKQLSGLPQHFDDGGLAQSLDQNASTIPIPPTDSLADLPAKKEEPSIWEQNWDKLISGPKEQDVAPSDVAPSAPVNQVYSPGGRAPTAAAPAPQAPAIPDYSKGLTQGISEQKAGINQVAGAEKTQGQIELQAAQDDAKRQQDFLDLHKRNVDNLQRERANILDDIDRGHIDPSHYISNLSAPGKVATAIGLILGGLGGGLTHQENPAMKFINDQISRDVEGQKLGLEKNKNLLAANTQAFGNLRDAEDFQKSIYAGMYANQLRKAAAVTKDPIAQGRALQAAGQLDAQYAQPLNDIALRHAAISQMNQGNAGAYTEALPQDMRERAVRLPNGGIGLAPTKEDAEGSRKAITSLSGLDKQLSDLENNMNQQGRSFNPWGTRAAGAENMRNSVVLELNQLHGLNRLNDNEFNSYMKSVPSPGDWNEGAAQAKINVLRKLVKDKMNDELTNHVQGFNPLPSANPRQAGPGFKR